MSRLRWLGYGIALATVVFAVVLAGRFGSDPGLVESPLIGRPAPGFELETLDGSGTVSLSDHRGQIVLVNFFASWCLECRLEHDDLLATMDVFGGSGVRLAQIAYQESSEAALAYLGEAGTTEWADYLADPGSRTAIAYGVFGIPETFFIDPEGIVVAKIIGEADAFTLGATIDAIRRGERPGQTVTGDTRRTPEG
ncbi:MAG: redoxin domain-containing protein [Actinobacteria bacterium]|nr:redoxin domain-containing protein [Actinomycetota bacterium]MCI0543459.1 redoxin domain-containing protein [Actinomycetota bacterium]MCI0677498.1 redoxin domain-containing protein [Actinomycetota bacterium]